MNLLHRYFVPVFVIIDLLYLCTSQLCSWVRYKSEKLLTFIATWLYLIHFLPPYKVFPHFNIYGLKDNSFDMPMNTLDSESVKLTKLPHIVSFISCSILAHQWTMEYRKTLCFLLQRVIRSSCRVSRSIEIWKGNQRLPAISWTFHCPV